MMYASQSQTQSNSKEMILKIPRISRFGLDKSKISRQKLVESLHNLLDDYQPTETHAGVSD